MKDLRLPPPSPTVKDEDNKSQTNTPSNRNVDEATIENNPKVDAQLISDFYRLIEASQGAIQSGRGANYGLSHPLDSKIVPTDLEQEPRRIENSLIKTKKIES